MWSCYKINRLILSRQLFQKGAGADIVIFEIGIVQGRVGDLSAFSRCMNKQMITDINTDMENFVFFRMLKKHQIARLKFAFRNNAAGFHLGYSGSRHI